MAKGPETLLVSKMVKAIECEWPSAWCFKVQGNPYQSAGVPDLLVVVAGRLVGIEVKAQRASETTRHAYGRVTLRQWASIEALRRAGAVAGPALSVDQAIALVRHALDGTTVSNQGLTRMDV